MRMIDGKRMKELLEKKQAKAVDVDSKNDFKKSHITGAINIPHDEKNFAQKVEFEIGKKNEQVVLCANEKVGPRLSILAKELEDAGYKDVYQYKANPSDWKSSNLNVRKEI